jgi:HSP20 family molecular chaperone IbpA
MNETSPPSYQNSGSLTSSETAPSHSVRVRPRHRSTYSDHAWKVEVDLPGVTKDHVSITIDQEVLRVSATRHQKLEASWRALGDYPTEKHYQLRLDVGPEVDGNQVQAVMENGRLTLTLPLRDEVKPRRIEVA